MSAVLPSGSGLPALLGIAALAAVLANVVNNLPATLVLVPLVATSGPAAVLAVLIGVNIGPNLTYVGSLSNLLWRRVLRQHACRRRRRRVHPPRAVHRAAGSGGGGGGAVGQCAGAWLIIASRRWDLDLFMPLSRRWVSPPYRRPVAHIPDPALRQVHRRPLPLPRPHPGGRTGHRSCCHSGISSITWPVWRWTPQTASTSPTPTASEC